MDIEYYFSEKYGMLVPAIAVFMLTAAFLIALFVKNNTRLLGALVFAAFGFTVFDVALIHSGLWFYFIVCGALIAMLNSDRKFVPWVMWISVALRTLRFVAGADWYIHGSIFLRIFFTVLPFLTMLGFAIATTAIRRKRIKKARRAETKKNTDDVFTASRENKNGCAEAGNILSAVSILLLLNFIQIITMGDNYYFNYITALKPVWSLVYALIPLTFICSLIAAILLSIARKYDYSDGVFSKILFVWSWIPTAIVVIVTVLVFLVMGAASGEGATSALNNASKKVYKIRDENGNMRTLDYDGTGTEAKDDKGEVWVTYDGGNTFRKRDVYTYQAPTGRTETLRDPYGSATTGTPSHLVANDGTEFAPSGRYGELEEKSYTHYDDGRPRKIIETYRVKPSDPRAAEVVEGKQLDD